MEPAGSDGAGAPRPATSWFDAGAAWATYLLNTLRGVPSDNEANAMVLAQRFGAKMQAAAEAAGVPPLPWEAAPCPEVLRRAAASNTPTLVYLHSDLHPDSCRLLADFLLHPDVSAALRGRVLLWGASAHCSDGWEAASTFHAAAFPFLTIVSPAGGGSGQQRFVQWYKHEGVLPPPASGAVGRQHPLWGPLSAGLAAAEGALGAARAEQTAREHEARLRREQDEAYAAAEAADRARAVARAAEASRAAEAAAAQAAAAAEAEWAAQEEQALQAALQLSQELGVESGLAAARECLAAHPEPPLDTPGGTTNLRFTLPWGLKLERRFLPSDTLTVVRHYLHLTLADLQAAGGAGASEAGALLKAGFTASTNFPRRTYNLEEGAASSDAGLDMKAAGLHPKAVLFVVEKK